MSCHPSRSFLPYRQQTAFRHMWNLPSTLQKSFIAFVSSRDICPTRGPADAAFVRTMTYLQASPETQYILRYEYIPDVLEKRGPFREEHLELARKHAIVGGPTTPLDASVPTGAFFTFASAKAAETFAALDPYVSAGIVTGYGIEEWTIAVKN